MVRAKPQTKSSGNASSQPMGESDHKLDEDKKIPAFPSPLCSTGEPTNVHESVKNIPPMSPLLPYSCKPLTVDELVNDIPDVNDNVADDGKMTKEDSYSDEVMEGNERRVPIMAASAAFANDEGDTNSKVLISPAQRISLVDPSSAELQDSVDEFKSPAVHIASLGNHGDARTSLSLDKSSVENDKVVLLSSPPDDVVDTNPIQTLTHATNEEDVDKKQPGLSTPKDTAQTDKDKPNERHVSPDHTSCQHQLDIECVSDIDHQGFILNPSTIINKVPDDNSTQAHYSKGLLDNASISLVTDSKISETVLDLENGFSDCLPISPKMLPKESNMEKETIE